MEFETSARCPGGLSDGRALGVLLPVLPVRVVPSALDGGCTLGLPHNEGRGGVSRRSRREAAMSTPVAVSRFEVK